MSIKKIKFRENWAWLVWAATSTVNFSTSYLAYQMSLHYEKYLSFAETPLNYLDEHHGSALFFIFSLNVFSSLCCLAIAFFYVKTEKKDRKNQRQLNLLSKRLMEFQLKERKAIARDIHDDLAQNVAALNLNLHLLKKISPPKSQKENDAFSNLNICIEKLSQKISHIISELRTPDYSKQRFTETLQELISKYESIFNIKITTHIKLENDPADTFTSENLYKILKEALNNVCKHSNANQVKISIFEEENSLKAIVEDNGIGFLNKTKADTYGLKGMKERVELLNGLLEINSEEGEGTKVTVAVPI